jgi:hypothetical protein
MPFWGRNEEAAERPTTEHAVKRGWLSEGQRWAVEHVSSGRGGPDLYNLLTMALDEGTAKGWKLHDVKIPATADAFIFWEKEQNRVEGAIHRVPRR